jgi:hypothetical protein
MALTSINTLLVSAIGETGAFQITRPHSLTGPFCAAIIWVEDALFLKQPMGLVLADQVRSGFKELHLMGMIISGCMTACQIGNDNHRVFRERGDGIAFLRCLLAAPKKCCALRECMRTLISDRPRSNLRCGTRLPRRG